MMIIDELFAAASSGDCDSFDRLCFGRSSTVTDDQLSKAYVEAGKNLQIKLLKHIYFRVKLDYIPKLIKQSFNQALCETFKLDNFEMLSLPYLDDEGTILLSCIEILLDEDVAINTLRSVVRGFFTSTEGKGFSERVADFCVRNQRADIYQVIKQEYTNAINLIRYSSDTEINQSTDQDRNNHAY